jgi:hypothetical protein
LPVEIGPPSGTALTPGGSRLVSKEKTQHGLRIQAESDGSGWLVWLQAPLPGWQVFVSGNPRGLDPVPANGLGMAVPITAGTFAVEFRYEPPGLAWGMRGTMIGGLLLVAGATLSLRGGLPSARRSNPVVAE